MPQSKFDIIIFGSGFGGSLMSMVAVRLGLRVLLLERGSHPRFAIGESTSPLTNLLLEQLANRYELPFLLPFTTFGAWQLSHPDIAVGLKRGFTYYAHSAGTPHKNSENRDTQLMVAASPSNRVSDTHWYRSEFDSFLVDRAVELGVEYRDHTEVLSIDHNQRGWQISATRHGEPFKATARLLLDATGPRGLLFRLLQLETSEFNDFPRMRALFSHFENVRRCDSMEAFCVPGEPPFAQDDAALHHTFDGGWMWVLRFNNGITSAGISVSDDLATELKLSEGGASAFQRFLDRFPSIAEQFCNAEPTAPFVYSPKLSFRSALAAGDGWAILPSAAAFIDPLFSTGIPLTLLGIERLAALLERSWPLNNEGLYAALAEYGETTLAEADATAEFVGASLKSLRVFDVFASFSMFYFAAASYSEMARRMQRERLAGGFLASRRHDFRTGMKRCVSAMPAVLANPTAENLSEYDELVAEAIGCINIAGLSDPSKRNWYGVDLQDVIANAHKLELSTESVARTVARAEWARA